MRDSYDSTESLTDHMACSSVFRIICYLCPYCYRSGLYKALPQIEGNLVEKYFKKNLRLMINTRCFILRKKKQT